MTEKPPSPGRYSVDSDRSVTPPTGWATDPPDAEYERKKSGELPAQTEAPASHSQELRAVTAARDQALAEGKVTREQEIKDMIAHLAAVADRTRAAVAEDKRAVELERLRSDAVQLAQIQTLKDSLLHLIVDLMKLEKRPGGG